MANFEFWDNNLLDTTTMVSLTSDSNTSTVINLFDRYTTRRYSTAGHGTSTSATIRINFDSTQTISRIVLQNHNLKQFRVYYNGVTANVITLETGRDTATTNYSTNSQTNHLWKFTAVDVTSVSIQMDLAQTADTEKKIGELWISDLNLRMDFNPDVTGYDPLIFNKQIRHEMSDGGVAIYDIRDKWRCKLKLRYKNSSMTTALRAIYNSKTDFCVAPFPTGTSWDGDIYNVVWTGPYDGLRPSGNAVSTLGYDHEFTLEETAN